MVEFVELAVIGALLMCFGSQVRSDAFDHRYSVGDSVPLYVNKVGPFHNPSETYAYFDLPFCSPDNKTEKKLGLGEMLNGDHLVSAPYKLEFLVNKDIQVLCRKRLNSKEVSLFRSVVEKDYYVQMFYDDLPIWAFIGRSEEVSRTNKYFLFKQFHFDILYNKDRVIEVNIRNDPNSMAELTEEKEVDVEFLYTVKWMETHTSFDNRMDKYIGSSVLPHHLRVHHFSIMNSSVTALILIGCLLMFYARVISKDISKYASDEELPNNQEETGWKVIHGDVFRFPKYKSLFAAALGTGTQFLTLMLIVLVLGVVGVFHPYDRGVLLNALVIIYAITFLISGYTSASFYYQLEGTNWMRNLLLTGGLFYGPLFLSFCFLNTVAIAYRVNAALPWPTILVIYLLWTLLASLLLLLGGITGKHRKSDFQAPCRTTKCPREIPQFRWYRGILPEMALAGILPFSVIYFELYYIFATVWGHKIYTIFDILSIVFMLLLIVTACMSVALTYFQLAAGNYEWWWRSFFCGGSTALYIYGYCFYYYFARSDMDGFLQTSFYFGYMACACLGMFLMLGSVGFLASLLFVRYLYGSIKCE